MIYLLAKAVEYKAQTFLRCSNLLKVEIFVPTSEVAKLIECWPGLKQIIPSKIGVSGAGYAI